MVMRMNKYHHIATWKTLLSIKLNKKKPHRNEYKLYDFNYRYNIYRISRANLSCIIEILYMLTSNLFPLPPGNYLYIFCFYVFDLFYFILF